MGETHGLRTLAGTVQYSRMDSGRWRQVPCWLLGIAIAAHGIATCVRARNHAWRERVRLTDDFVDHVSLFEQETGRLRGRLGQRDYVEYVTDLPIERADVAHFRRLMLFQYAMSPTVLGHRPPDAPGDPPRRRLLIADFPTERELGAFLDGRGFEVRWRRGPVALLGERGVAVAQGHEP